MLLPTHQRSTESASFTHFIQALYGCHVDRYTALYSDSLQVTDRAGRLEYLLVHFLISSLQNQGGHNPVRLTAPRFSFLERKKNKSAHMCVSVWGLAIHQITDHYSPQCSINLSETRRKKHLVARTPIALLVSYLLFTSINCIQV